MTNSIDGKDVAANMRSASAPARPATSALSSVPQDGRLCRAVGGCVVREFWPAFIGGDIKAPLMGNCIYCGSTVSVGRLMRMHNGA